MILLRLAYSLQSIRKMLLGKVPGQSFTGLGGFHGHLLLELLLPEFLEDVRLNKLPLES